MGGLLSLGPQGFSGPGQCLHRGISTRSTWHPRVCQVGHAQPSVSLFSRHVDGRSFRAPGPDRRQKPGPNSETKAEHSKRSLNLANRFVINASMQLRLGYQFVALCLKPPGYKAGIRLARYKFGEERKNFVDKGSGALVISVLNSWGFRISWGGGISPTEAANYVGLCFLPSGLRGFGELRRRCETGNLLIALFFWFLVFLLS